MKRIQNAERIESFSSPPESEWHKGTTNSFRDNMTKEQRENTGMYDGRDRGGQWAAATTTHFQ